MRMSIPPLCSMRGLVAALGMMGVTAGVQAETFSLVMQPPNGEKIPKIMGANANVVPSTGYDYMVWFGMTHHRTWFKPKLASRPDNSSVTTAEAFDAATKAIRRDPGRQGTPADFYIDWEHYERQVDRSAMRYLQDLGIQSMISNERFVNISGEDIPISGDWPNTFRYWKSWYWMVYSMASNFDVTLYQFRNEPSSRDGDYDTWESHWLVAADAMRKAMADVNRDFGKNLPVYVVGHTGQGPYWDYSLSDPLENPRGWGSVSWKKVKVDVFGTYDVSNPWNYGMYDYHRYTASGAKMAGEISQTRHHIANARNDPHPDIPIVLTEINTHTAKGFRNSGKDTDDLDHGIANAQIYQATAEHLGDEGGFFVFKLGAAYTWVDPPFAGNFNNYTYSSRGKPHNNGGVTRGGAALQLYTRNFRGGKKVVPFDVTAGAHEERRVVAAMDEELGEIHIYGSNVTGVDDTVHLDLSQLDVLAGAPVTLQRVDVHHMGQITECVTLDSSKSLSFSAPHNTAYLVTVATGTDVNGVATEIPPSDDTYQSVGTPAFHGDEPTMKVSLHHADAAKRRAALLRFQVTAEQRAHRVLLKLSGKNSGVDPTRREILHVYAVPTETDWSEEVSIAWTSLPGLGKYHINGSLTGSADGSGAMVDIEDTYAGVTDGAGTGLGVHGTFLGSISFHSPAYETAGLDVTDYLNAVGKEGATVDVTFLVVRIVRYNVNEYDGPQYDPGVFHYDDRVVEIASDEHADPALRPKLVCWGADNVAPELSPGVWASVPEAISASVIHMTAGTVYDPSGAQYFFTETSGNPGGDDSGWQSSPSYTDKGLSPDVQYAYTVTVRDRSGNISSPSEMAAVTTPGDTDEEAPSPNPMSWAFPPALDTVTSVQMTASVADDASGGVEYYFDETSGNPGGKDSGWQSDPSYTDTGLARGLRYSYRVTARDISRRRNITGASSTVSVTTPGRILFKDTFSEGALEDWVSTPARKGDILDESEGRLEAVSQSANIQSLVATFPAADLSEKGAKISLSLKFQILEDLGDSTITLGLYDSNGTRIESDGSPNGIDDSGYWLYNNARRYWLKAGYGTGLGDVNGTTSLAKKDPSPFATADGKPRTFSLEIENRGGRLHITQKTDAGLPSERKLSGGDATGKIPRIDQVVIQVMNKKIAIGDVVVTH